MEPRNVTVEIDVGELDALIWEPGSVPADGERTPTVLALHGFPESAREWEPVAGLLAREGVRVVAPHQRGYAPGARPIGVEAYAIEHLARDVLQVARTLAPGPVHLVGHDWGAAVAWWVAAFHPDAVETLTAVSVPHLGAFAAALATDPDQQQRSAYFRLLRQQGKAEQVLAEDDFRRVRAMFGGAVPARLVEAHLELIGRGSGLTGALNWYRAIRRYEVPDVAVPTTFVWGEQDMAIARSGAEATAARVTGEYRFVPVRDGGHWIPECFPELLTKEILARIR